MAKYATKHDLDARAAVRIYTRQAGPPYASTHYIEDVYTPEIHYHQMAIYE
jgi:hypothetical protein